MDTAKATIAGLVVVASLVLLSGCSAPAQSFTMTGTVQVALAGGSNAGDPCPGADYSGIATGAQVIVTDSGDKTIAAGKLGKGTTTDLQWCAYPFKVSEVPAGEKFYKVQVRRATMQYTEAAARNPVTLTVGGR